MEVRQNRDGSRSFRVVYRDGGRRRVKSFRGGPEAKKAAKLFTAQLAQARLQANLPSLTRGDTRLMDFYGRFWTEYAVPNLSPRTQSDYEDLLARLIVPYLGGVKLRDLNQGRLSRWLVELERDGVGTRSRAKALTCLQSVLSRARAWDVIEVNGASGMAAPKSVKRTVDPMPPSEVEAVREALLAMDKAPSAALVSVMAYAGLRPQEALALEWPHVRERTLLICQKVELDTGRIVAGQKTRKGSDTVDLIAPLKWELEQLRQSAQLSLVFPSFRKDAWNKWDWNNWRRRVWAVACEAAGVPYRRPYDLRHSFASLMIQEGASAAEVAAQMRNTVKVTLDTYTHLFTEFRDEGRPARIAGRVNEARTGGLDVLGQAR